MRRACAGARRRAAPALVALASLLVLAPAARPCSCVDLSPQELRAPPAPDPPEEQPSVALVAGAAAAALGAAGVAAIVLWRRRDRRIRPGRGTR